ncbi:MAG: hypothetical protein PHV63_00195 [Candidatus Daviesbacteria bacterium]|nr:hypothetical protein [Candidatus Daviesbacteria bacterium]
MSKFKVLGFINCLLVILPIIIRYPLNLVFLFSLGLNIYLGYKLLWEHYDPTKFKQYLTLTFLTGLWLIWGLIGYLFALGFAYLIISFVLITGIFVFIRELSVKLALLVSFATFLVVVQTIAWGFEDDHCWKKGDEMAVGKPGTMVIPGQEAKNLFGSNNIDISASSSAEVGTAAYYHFKCHQDFDLGKVLRDKYIPMK